MKPLGRKWEGSTEGREKRQTAREKSAYTSGTAILWHCAENDSIMLIISTLDYSPLVKVI